MNATEDRTPLHALGSDAATLRALLAQELSAYHAAAGALAARERETMPGREWTPAQQHEHVLRISHAVGRSVRLLLSERELRPVPFTPGERAAGKRLSPPEFEPQRGLGAGELAPAWAALGTELQASTEHLRPTPGRTLPHPFFGELDAVEWVQMLILHTRMHRQQLEALL